MMVVVFNAIRVTTTWDYKFVQIKEAENKQQDVRLAITHTVLQRKRFLHKPLLTNEYISTTQN